MADQLSVSLPTPCELRAVLDPRKGRFERNFEDQGLKFMPCAVRLRSTATQNHSLARSKSTLPRLPGIEGANYAGIVSAGCDSPKFESRTRCSGTSPLQDRRTVDLRGFRGAPPSSRSVRGQFRPLRRSTDLVAPSSGSVQPEYRCRSALPVADPRIGSRPPRAPCLLARLDTESLATLHCFVQRTVRMPDALYAARNCGALVRGRGLLVSTKTRYNSAFFAKSAWENSGEESSSCRHRQVP